MAYRVERIEKILEREIATILFDSAHNDKLKFISITKVSLTKDLSIATVYYTVLGNQGEIESTKKEFENANYGSFKNAVAEAVVDTIRPIQDKYNDLMKNKDYLKQVYKSGADKANRTAMKTLSKVYRKVGFIEP